MYIYISISCIYLFTHLSNQEIPHLSAWNILKYQAVIPHIHLGLHSPGHLPAWQQAGQLAGPNFIHSPTNKTTNNSAPKVRKISFSQHFPVVLAISSKIFQVSPVGSPYFHQIFVIVFDFHHILHGFPMGFHPFCPRSSTVRTAAVHGPGPGACRGSSCRSSAVEASDAARRCSMDSRRCVRTSISVTWFQRWMVQLWPFYGTLMWFTWWLVDGTLWLCQNSYGKWP